MLLCRGILLNITYFSPGVVVLAILWVGRSWVQDQPEPHNSTPSEADKWLLIPDDLVIVAFLFLLTSVESFSNCF